MSREDKNEKLISIEEFIARAKRFGVDFGDGDPKNRLRYYVKIGLLPHAQRKSFNGLPPNGAYSEKTLEILLEIDKKLKAGKSIQAIKREIGKEEEIFKESFFEKSFTPSFPETEKEFQTAKRPKFIFKPAAFLKTGLILLVLGAIAFFAAAKIDIKDIAPYFLAVTERAAKLVQLPPDLLPEEEREEILAALPFEPYLTINAETAVNAPLKVKEKITAPTFALIRDELEGRMIVAGLTADREYNFPDLSGTVCLTAGNCVGLGGEVLTTGGTPDRLAKFISEQEIGDSSISDLYPGGVAMTIDSTGNVGIGIENPRYPLHVQGRIQATGDICTNLAGGRCLSTLAMGGAPAAAGIGGSGTASYLPAWTGATTLGNSELYQTNGNIGIGTTSPTAALTVAGSGLFQGTLTIENGQLALLRNGLNNLTFTLADNYAEISASSTFVINSLTGEVRLGGAVTLFDAAGAEIRGRTFISDAADSTVRKSGELVFRNAVPIFRFAVPSQTSSTTYTSVSRTFLPADSLDLITPDQLPGTNRVYAFLINFADDIDTTSSSTWRVYRPNAATTTFTFEFAGQNLASLQTGNPHLTATATLPDNDWRLDVRVPSADKNIRIFNILLLTYDQIL